MVALRLTQKPGASIAMAVLLASIAGGCATQKPVVKAKETVKEPAPVQEVVKEEVKPETLKPLEFDKVYYEYNKANIRNAGKESLKKAVEQLLARPEAKVNVDGHCDERGTDEYNIDLGWKRAYAVRDYLKRLGVDDSRLFPASYGRARPAMIGNDESVWNKNRRVEISERK